MELVACLGFSTSGNRLPEVLSFSWLVLVPLFRPAADGFCSYRELRGNQEVIECKIFRNL
jgi:hypothetical protein